MNKRIHTFYCPHCNVSHNEQVGEGEMRVAVCGQCCEILYLTVTASGDPITANRFHETGNPFVGIWKSRDDGYSVVFFPCGEDLIATTLLHRRKDGIDFKPRSAFSFRKAKGMYVMTNKSLKRLPSDAEELRVYSAKMLAKLVPTIENPILKINNTTVAQAIMHDAAPIDNKET